MADSGNATEMRHLSASSRGQAKNTPNLSGGWVVMLLSGLVAAVLFFFATQQTSNRIDVAILARDIPAGQPVDAGAFTRAQVAAADTQLARLIRYDDRSNYDGWVAAGPLSAGDLVPKSALREPAASAQRRSMSVPVDKAHANNGNLRSGDRIDVIMPEDPNGYVARNIEVLSVHESSGSGGIGSITQFVVVVAVDEDQAVQISQAVANGKFDLVRTTGTPPGTQTGTSGTATAPSAPSGTSNTTTTTTTTRSTGSRE